MFKRTAFFLVATVFGVTAAHAADKVQIGDQKVFPESMTSTADGTLFAGSLTQGTIFRAAPGATKAEAWVPKPADGPPGISGVYADEKTGTLWACYVDLATFSGKGAPAVLRAIDLKSGAIKASYPFPGPSFCNDIATTADGTAYVTDTASGAIMRLKPGATALEVWLKAPELAGIDGITFTTDGTMYVNSVMANTLMSVAMDMAGAPGKVSVLKLSEPIKGPDGLRAGANGALYVAENGNGRVDAVTVDGDNATLKTIKDGLDSPTAMSEVGNTLWILEAKTDQMAAADPGAFYMWPVPLGQ